MNTGPIIVVTGGNHGIGFEICRQTCGRGARVVLTARKPEAGVAADAYRVPFEGQVLNYFV